MIYRYDNCFMLCNKYETKILMHFFSCNFTNGFNQYINKIVSLFTNGFNHTERIQYYH